MVIEVTRDSRGNINEVQAIEGASKVELQVASVTYKDEAGDNSRVIFEVYGRHVKFIEGSAYDRL